MEQWSNLQNYNLHKYLDFIKLVTNVEFGIKTQKYYPYDNCLILKILIKCCLKNDIICLPSVSMNEPFNSQIIL